MPAASLGATSEPRLGGGNSGVAASSSLDSGRSVRSACSNERTAADR
jgi:hypothetical protein